MNNKEEHVAISREWLKNIVLWLILASTGGAIGGAMRLDPYYGTQGRALEERMKEVELDHSRFAIKLETIERQIETHDQWIGKAPPQWFRERVEKDIDAVATDIHDLQKDIKELRSLLRQIMMQNRRPLTQNDPVISEN